MLLWPGSIVCLFYLFNRSLLTLAQSKDAALAKQHGQNFSGEDFTVSHSIHSDDKSPVAGAPELRRRVSMSPGMSSQRMTIPSDDKSQGGAAQVNKKKHRHSV